jgi:hypothetical protein
MSALPLLIVIVIAGGGPPGTKPFRPVNGVVRLYQPVSCRVPGCIPPPPPEVASGAHGKLEVRLRPGKYSATAYLGGTFCESRDLRMQRGHTTRLTLRCSIP